MRMMLTACATLALLGACSGGKSDAPTQREQIGHSWKYDGKDGAPGQKDVAYIGSVNSVQTMTAPDTFSVLLLQPLGKGETGVTIKLVGAPFICDLSACAVSVRTDDGKSHRWTGRMTDNKDGITIPPSQNAYEAIKGARTLRVDLIVGPKDKMFDFQFDVEGLNWKG